MKYIKLPWLKWTYVDNEDYDYLNQWKWHCNAGGYVVRNSKYDKSGKRYAIFMHREILGLSYKDGKYTDHINHNILDNRKKNIRVCTSAENQYNQKVYNNCLTKYKGVSWHKRDKKWVAGIRVNKVLKHLGYFEDKMIAALIYDLYAVKYFGEFACTNFGPRVWA